MLIILLNKLASAYLMKTKGERKKKGEYECVRESKIKKRTLLFFGHKGYLRHNKNQKQGE
jgi:hypothetical protein